MNKNTSSKNKLMTLRQRLMLLGPAFIISIGYIDPGNYATNIQAGSNYGYDLLWVGIVSCLIAMFIQYLSAKLGIVTGNNLTEHLGNSLNKPQRILYWIQAELVIIATDFAEFIGAAIGFQIILHIPLMLGAVLTGIFTVIMLMVNNSKLMSQKPLEVFTAMALFFIAGAYIIEMALSHYGHTDALLQGLFVPRLHNYSEVYFAAGILGATIMPHVIYLHSGLFKTYQNKNIDKRSHLSVTKKDIIVALSVATFANLAMIVMAATVFYYSGYTNISSIYTAYQTLIPILGKAAGTVFALSLIVSGLSSSVVATLAGDLVMQGFTKRRVHIVVRRLVTMIPIFIVIMTNLSPTLILVLSQVVLSFGVVFALMPLLIYTNKKSLMGEFANPKYLSYIGYFISVIIAALNIYIAFAMI